MTARRRAALAALAATALLPATTASAAGMGAISGTVSAGGEPVCVLALGPTGDAVATTATDDAGVYTLSEVPEGTWTVEFDPDDGCLGFDSGYAFQFYAGASTPATATPVAVTAGQTTTGVNAELPEGGTVGGTVTDNSGAPLGAVCVILEDTAGRPVVRQPTDPQGNYELTQLPPGRFIVQFVDDDCAGEPASYASTYYPDAATPAAAQVITVAAGTITGPIAGALVALPTSAGGSGGANGREGAAGSGGGGTAGTTQGTPGGGSDVHIAPLRQGLVELLRAAGGRWTIDRHWRLHLRMSCTHATACSTEVTVRAVRKLHGRLARGRLLGKQRVTVRARAPASVSIKLSRHIRSSRLWIGIRFPGAGPLLRSLIPVRRTAR